MKLKIKLLTLICRNGNETIFPSGAKRYRNLYKGVNSTLFKTIFPPQLPDIPPPEHKEYKPGPIGKERSLKNRKAAKDVRQSDGEGLDKNGTRGSRDRDSSSPTKDKVPELGGDIEGMITAPSAEYSSSSKVQFNILLL